MASTGEDFAAGSVSTTDALAAAAVVSWVVPAYDCAFAVVDALGWAGRIGVMPGKGGITGIPAGRPAAKLAAACQGSTPGGNPMLPALAGGAIAWLNSYGSCQLLGVDAEVCVRSDSATPAAPAVPG